MKTVPAVLCALSVSFSAAADQGTFCKPILAQISTRAAPCPADFDSSVGLCTTGTVISLGQQWASTRYRALAVGPSAGMSAVEPATTLSYAGELELSTPLGVVILSDVGILDGARALFTEVARVTGGTGIFAKASGRLFVSGTTDATGTSFDGTVGGTLCF